MAANVNILLTTFPGLNLPSTICLSLDPSSSVRQLHEEVAKRLPLRIVEHLYLSTQDGLPLGDFRSPVDRLIHHDTRERSLLPLRLNARLRGGKGGFGSQLRAAGGRMSSRKKKQNAEQATSSARNLDGRRLRTIAEAKNLATYLATKPDMDRKEKEERRKRWEAVVDLAEQREADMRAGKTLDGRRKGLSSEWMEEKEEVGENVKNAVKLAMAANEQEHERSRAVAGLTISKANADGDSDSDDPMELDESEMNRLQLEAEAGDVDAMWVLRNKLNIPTDLLPKVKPKASKFEGFDDDLSESESEAEASQSAVKLAVG